jgi:indole-3-glycerol phosphate synthase
MTPGSILDRIIATTANSLEERRRLKSLDDVRRIASQTQHPRDFYNSINGDNIRLIAEIKKASPSRGVFPIKRATGELARIYASAGAAAISIVTEPVYFLGTQNDIKPVKDMVPIPVLCKDFIIDPYQVYEARAAGADAILLIAAAIGTSRLRDLVNIASDEGMASLVEVHNIRDLEKAMSAPVKIIGINNRNLDTFEVRLETTLELRPLVPPGLKVVSESGIHDTTDVYRLRQAKVNAVLVGESLVTNPDPGGKIAELFGLTTTNTPSTAGAVSQD